MRLLVVTSQFPIAGEPNRGRPLLQTVRALSGLAEVRVLSPVATYPDWARPRSYLFRAGDEAFRVEGIDAQWLRYPALPLLTRPFNGHLCARSLHAPLREFAPDVVLAYWLYPDGYGAMRAAARAGVPLVVGARGSDLRVRDALSRRLTRPVLHAARRILTVSEDLGRVAVRDYGADPAKLRTIANGCDAAIFHPRPRADMRARLGVVPEAELVVYVGRLVPEKGLGELVDAVAALQVRRPRLQLALVGEGPMRADLDARIAAHPGLTVHLPGAQPPDRVAEWMAASHLVTLPSYSEGHPNVLVEALACGRPAVATPVGGIPEVVDADCGVLVAVRDAAALADGLDAALSRDWEEAVLARRFSRGWDAVAADTLRACEEALQEHRLPPSSRPR